MMALLLHGAKDHRATDLPEPVAGPGEVVIAMRRAWLCCPNPVRDTSRKSSVLGAGLELSRPPRLQDQELARL